MTISLHQYPLGIAKTFRFGLPTGEGSSPDVTGAGGIINSDPTGYRWLGLGE
ncbi:hypothetical protein BC30090_p214 (plasmid) [Bacillus cereus]|nr:hypothetical protein H175_68p08 [Bacillus thuringiensis serovar thuringiensis str. IS5056]ETE87800.1 hypothetical protein C623_0235285 [Bacillus thuringiensis serovar aizawai str. Hu4-2]BCC21325.1 hypothetical protein BCM0075_p218 [Bacillus cereus]BCD09014.1 hypothetical protein BC30052_p346 [Bacillus cereus]BCD26808.1 hypothetical protein BC30090_p214 [Bacillus cereus]